MTVADLHSDMTIVVNCGIDSVNHHFSRNWRRKLFATIVALLVERLSALMERC